MIPRLVTDRLTVKMRPINIRQAIELAGIPRQEEATTFFLACTVEAIEKGPPLKLWSVNERMLAVAHYIAAHIEDGPDFAIGKGRYSDYLDLGAQALPKHTLTGEQAEMIEISASGSPAPVLLHWMLGVYVCFTSAPETADDLLAKVEALLEEPQGKLDEIAEFVDREFSTPFLFVPILTAQGIGAAPVKEESPLPAARFPVSAVISPRVQAMAR